MDHDQGLVYIVTSDPIAHGGCDFDLSGAAWFVVSLARNALPDSPFTLRLNHALRCGACPDEQVTVDVR